LSQDFRGRGRPWGIFFGFYKTRYILLAASANCTVLHAVVLTQYRRARDGRTDGRTDRQTDGIAVASIASSCNASIAARCKKVKMAVGRVLGRPFVKRFAQCYRTVLCLSCLSVTLVYHGQPLDESRCYVVRSEASAQATLYCCNRVSQPTPSGHLPFIFQLTFRVHVYIVRGCRLRAKLTGAAFRPATRRWATWQYAPVYSALTSPVHLYTVRGATVPTVLWCALNFPRIMRVQLN